MSVSLAVMLFVKYEFVSISWAAMLFVQYEFVAISMAVMLFVQYEFVAISMAVMLFVRYEFVAISWAVIFFEQYAASPVIQVSKMSLNNLSKDYIIDCLHHLLPYVLHAEKVEWPEVLDIVR
jgi:hypothetical protein